MSTLLCSILIGYGFPAMVVSGYATREVTCNDQRRVKCPYIPQNVILSEKEKELDPKYRLRERPFLKSRFLMKLEDNRLQAEKAKADETEQLQQLKIAEEERFPDDPEEILGRVHSWIVMLMNGVPWCYKQDFKVSDDVDDEENMKPQAFFIEPSTGFRHELNDSRYLGIESIWNHQNYYVNRQYPSTFIEEMSWELKDTEKWEHFLPGEPFEFRQTPSNEEENVDIENKVLASEKHFYMPFSWVEMLKISAVDFEQRYLNGVKKEFYKYAVFEKFAPYLYEDGLMKKLTLYETLDYEKPLMIFKWYGNREDNLNFKTEDLETKQCFEEFHKGRIDSLKSLTYNDETSNEPVIMKFYAKSRFDCIETIKYHSEYIEEFYLNRRDLLAYRKFFVKDSHLDALSRTIEKIIEKFNRNESKPAIQDVAVRHFNRKDSTIFVRFHFDDDAVTATTKIFVKPPRSEEEPKFSADEIEGYVSNPWQSQMNSLELFYLLQSLIKDEEKSVDSYHIRECDIKEILEVRKNQNNNPHLNISIFDSLRNSSARNLRLKRFEQMKTREILAKSQQADFLAPYLIRFEDKKPQREEVDIAIQECLRDFKNNFADIENELQRRYDDTTIELNSLKRFLSRHMDQFTVQDYDKFITEGENNERHRKIIQQRIIAVREEANRKYKNLVESIPMQISKLIQPDEETKEEEIIDKNEKSEN